MTCVAKAFLDVLTFQTCSSRLEIGHLVSGSTVSAMRDLRDSSAAAGKQRQWCVCMCVCVRRVSIHGLYSASDYLRGACWSPSRAGVLLCCRDDGSIDIWDLCDQSHRAVASEITIGASSLSAVQYRQFSGGKSHAKEFVAIGDAGGNLHVVQLPRNFRKSVPNEMAFMEEFFEREGKTRQGRDDTSKKTADVDREDNAEVRYHHQICHLCPLESSRRAITIIPINIAITF